MANMCVGRSDEMLSADIQISLGSVFLTSWAWTLERTLNNLK